MEPSKNLMDYFTYEGLTKHYDVQKAEFDTIYNDALQCTALNLRQRALLRQALHIRLYEVREILADECRKQQWREDHKMMLDIL